MPDEAHLFQMPGRHGDAADLGVPRSQQTSNTWPTPVIFAGQPSRSDGGVALRGFLAQTMEWMRDHQASKNRSQISEMSDAELEQAILGCMGPSSSGKAETASEYLIVLQHEKQRRASREVHGPGNRHARRAKAAKQRRIH